MRDQIKSILSDMRPAFQRDGGDIELVDIDESTGLVSVRMSGACKGCPMSEITLKAGVEATLIENVPGVTEVIAVE
ncbi:MAG: NifU family protein [Patescibacteria group bacterium]